jgi:hypothetical protein
MYLYDLDAFLADKETLIQEDRLEWLASLPKELPESVALVDRFISE